MCSMYSITHAHMLFTYVRTYVSADDAQAVINENTTGNVLQLQAEIRRLRALLDQGRGEQSEGWVKRGKGGGNQWIVEWVSGYQS